MHRYQLKLDTGRVVTWTGDSGEDAAWRYARAHEGATVVAWREMPNHVASVHPSQIIG